MLNKSISIQHLLWLKMKHLYKMYAYKYRIHNTALAISIVVCITRQSSNQRQTKQMQRGTFPFVFVHSFERRGIVSKRNRYTEIRTHLSPYTLCPQCSSLFWIVCTYVYECVCACIYENGTFIYPPKCVTPCVRWVFLSQNTSVVSPTERTMGTHNIDFTMTTYPFALCFFHLHEDLPGVWCICTCVRWNVTL